MAVCPTHILQVFMNFFSTAMAMVALAITAPVNARPLPISRLVSDALHKNPEIRYYEAEIEAARGGRQSAGRLPDPELSIEAGGMSLAGQKDGAVWRAQMLQAFDFPGRTALRKAIADQDIALAELGLEQFRSQLASQIRALAGDLVLLRKKETAARKVRERLQSLVEVLVQRDPGGVSALLERRILEAALLGSDRAMTNAAKEAQAASITLAVLCSLPTEAALELEMEAAETRLPKVSSLETLKQQAALTNFELHQKRLQVARQGLKVDLSKTERWSGITFGPYMAGQHAGGTQMEGGFVLSIPLPLWNKNKGHVAAEQARTLQAEALLTAALRDLERDLSITRASYLSELAALSRWRDESETEFQQAAEEADRHYRLGAVPAATYVEMQRGYLDALDTLVESQRNAWKHRMELEHLLGTSLSRMEAERVTTRN